MVPEDWRFRHEIIIELREQGDEEEPAQPRDQFGLAAVPALEPWNQGGGADHFALEVAIELIGQRLGGRIAVLRRFFQAFQADGLQLPGDLWSQLSGGMGSRSSTATTVSMIVSASSGGWPVRTS